MPAIPILESEHGATLYIHPYHVTAISTADGEDALCLVWMSNGPPWRVKGGAQEVAAHLLGYEVGPDEVPAFKFQPLGRPSRTIKMTSDAGVATVTHTPLGGGPERTYTTQG
jgi:hypothetical protein